MHHQHKKKRPSSSKKAEKWPSSSKKAVVVEEEEEQLQQQDLLPLLDKANSNGIRSEVGQPVSCLHHGGNVCDNKVIINELLDLICRKFMDAFSFLPVGERPELITRLYGSGHCLGLLEPLSNIVVNTILHPELQMDPQKSGESGSMKSGRMPGGITQTCYQKQYWIVPARQSLEGLIVFLRFYFRYLSLSQALRYLYLAQCDLVLAIGLVESDLLPDKEPFTFHDSAGMSTKSVDALYLAAVAAKHPYADKVSIFVARRFREHSADRFRSIMKAGKPISAQTLYSIVTHLKHKKEKPYVTASSLRYESFSVARDRILLPDAINKMPNFKEKKLCEYSDTIERILLDALYAFYMKAFYCLGKPLFCALQTAILRSGLCFGPFGDPVENILLNAIWFHNAFPKLSENSVLQLVHSERISILCKHSLDANISFLRRKYSKLCSHDAILVLYKASLNRSHADNFLSLKGYTRDTDDHTAAIHALQGIDLAYCDPQMALFHSMPSGKMNKIKQLLYKEHHSRILNIHDLNAISEEIGKVVRSPLELPPRQLSLKATNILTEKMREFKHKGKRITKKLEKLIEAHYADEHEAEAVHMQIICIFGGHRSYSAGRSFFHVNVLTFHASKKKHGDLFFAQLWESPEVDPEFDCIIKLHEAIRKKGVPLASHFEVWTKATSAGMDSQAYSLSLFTVSFI